MALEERLASLEAKIEKLTEVSEKLISLRTEAIETVKNAAAPAPKATKASAKETKEPAKVEEPTPAPEDDSAYAEAKALVAEYTTGSERPEEVQARKTKIRELLRHEKLVKPEFAKATAFSVTDVMDDKIPVLIKNIKALIERGDLTQPAAAADDPDLL